MEKLGSVDPQRIGAYRLLGRLGAGGMGQVYLARSDRGRTVAIKLVREELAEQQEFRDRFRREVMAARRLGSTWTAPVLDADTDADVPWVATGYVAGPSLQTTVSGRASTSASPAPGAYGPLPERSVHILGNGLAHALRAIHTAGLIHRDLKPSNILLTIDGPRVIDFGIARALDTVTDSGLTRTGALVGSPGFMSPEQVRGERVTTACDVFCLGSVLAYASTGRLPFGDAASGVHALLFRIAQEDPDLTGVPVDLVELIQDCLRKDPAARPVPDEILDRLAEDNTSEPWLPGALLAQLGRHAVELLDSEDPQDAEGPGEAEAPENAAAPESVAPPEDAVPQDTPPPPPAEPATSPEHPAPGSTHPPRTTAGPQQPATPAAGPPVPGTYSPGTYSGTPSPGYGYPQQPAQPYAAAYPAATPAPGYGYPQQQSPDQGYAYGYPQQPGFGSTPPYDPQYPTGTQPPAPGPARRRAGSTVALVAIAVLVAIGAGGSVYALMSDSGGDTASPNHSTTPSPKDDSSDSGSNSSDGTQDPSPTDGGEDGVPEAYLGTWSSGIDNAVGHSTRELVIQQGGAGDTVLSLTAEGPTDAGGTYRCVFQAALTDAATGEDPLRIGPSTVTLGEPMSSCTPGGPTTLTLLPDGTLSRENTDTGERLTYTKSE
ncbi:protein kinase [Streptomyces sp. NBC_01260]|uniref:serine/threonine-protein kinase n=1 Tax=unclassified Streptomyces TaxID=2593676 RepID=UPI000F46B859|nr:MULTISPECIES: serine/threonine-protein kinase [unclassified Streptomyces]ROQ81063.1 serine/threonine protein kinase [Streptomyces sp. CEV 2-1]RPK48477.1 Serine/threonine-protein kinase AfsK [Streptomyces sp. ADI92-24]